MDNSMVEVLLAQGMGEQEAYKRISCYYQMLSEGRSRVEARQALRGDKALDYLGTLVRTAINNIIGKGFQPEEVEDAIHEYYHPEPPRRPVGFNTSPIPVGISENSLDEEYECEAPAEKEEPFVGPPDARGIEWRD